MTKCVECNNQALSPLTRCFACTEKLAIACGAVRVGSKEHREKYPEDFEVV